MCQGAELEGERSLLLPARRRGRLHRRRAEKIGRLIAEQPRTPHEIAQELWAEQACHAHGWQGRERSGCFVAGVGGPALDSPKPLPSWAVADQSPGRP